MSSRNGEHKRRQALLKTSTVASLCGVTGETVLAWVKAGDLSATRTPGGHYRFRQTDVDALMYPDVATEIVAL